VINRYSRSISPMLTWIEHGLSNTALSVEQAAKPTSYLPGPHGGANREPSDEDTFKSLYCSWIFEDPPELFGPDAAGTLNHDINQSNVSGIYSFHAGTS
jgi:hypothetical protein